MPLWPSVRRELRAARALMPLIYADGRLPWSPVATAVDASPWGYGVVEAVSSPSELGAIGRLRERERGSAGL